jgi:hypothetical protein
MRANSLDLTIFTTDLAAKAFLALKRFDSTILMGVALQRIREQQPFYISLDCSDREALLVRFIKMLDELEQLHITYEISANNVPRTSDAWQPTIWNRADVVIAVETIQEKKRIAEIERQKSQEWLNSKEGKEHVAFFQRLAKIREFLESRWGALGFENLLPIEMNYVHAWWLCVEVDTGGFEQYFSNSSGDNALLALSALQIIGAHNAQEILANALRLFDIVGGYKVDRKERCVCLKALPDNSLRDLSFQFYDLKEDIRSLALIAVEREYEKLNLKPETI